MRLVRIKKNFKTMKFRPCIDIHNGQVKQIVGSTLSSDVASLETNFVATQSAADFARMYANDDLPGGHVIRLDTSDQTKKSALAALAAYPGGLQIGGGITDLTAEALIVAGAQKVIVTSFCFTDGKLDLPKLQRLVDRVGADKIVIDLACRKRNGQYFVVTNTWQTFTDTAISAETIATLSDYVSEFLVHDVDLEGKKSGIDQNLIQLLVDTCPLPITYAGGIRNAADIALIKTIGQTRIDYTIGSALDIFGGELSYRVLVDC
jgi:phosphoribosylformimino-5-aminoimidazole carboxamide ribotide isomerase